MTISRLVAWLLVAHCLVLAVQVHGWHRKDGKEIKNQGREMQAISYEDWSYGFLGMDWTTPPEGNSTPWFCTTGQKQSPVDIRVDKDDMRILDETLQLNCDFGIVTSNGSDVKVINTGHTLQVDWEDSTHISNVSVVIPSSVTEAPFTAAALNVIGNSTERVMAQPDHLHFHATSEHMIQGRGYPAELHFVSRVQQDEYPGCPEAGCFVVVGVFLELADEANPAKENTDFQQILDFAPSEDNATTFLAPNMTLDLNNFLPANRSYALYEGSLTSPPCFEGLLWHVMLNPLQISRTQFIKLLTIMGENNCDTVSNATVAFSGQSNCTKTPYGQNSRLCQPMNGRVMKFFLDQ